VVAAAGRAAGTAKQIEGIPGQVAAAKLAATQAAASQINTEIALTRIG
jgi:hypothetical protein